MRLHSLTLTAFGPFGSTETVDFDALAGPGLFLMHGPTGAGKTSVLDAVCFALYGVVPGVRQQAARLRSDHAAPEVATRVVLEVTVRGRRLRLTRSPGWERPKRRGAGTTREQPRVLVEELRCSAAPEVLSTRLDEAGQLVRDLVGMSAEQFCQVVLLPQGRFAEFLRASAEERRPLLEQLFGTGRFSAVEAELANQRQVAKADLDQARAGVSALLARVVEAAGADTAPEDAEGTAVQGWVARLLDEAHGRADAARQAERAARAIMEGRRQEAESQASLADRQHRFRQAAQRAAELRTERVSRAARADELAAARRAAVLVPLIEGVQSADDEVQAAARALGRARDALPSQLYQMTPGQLTAAAAEARAEAAGLERLEDDAATEQQLICEIAAQDQAVQRADREAQRLQTELCGIPRQIADVELRIALARGAAAALPGLRAEGDALRRAASAAVRRDALVQQTEVLTERLREATDGAQSRREMWLDLREQRLHGIAAELAAGLEDGADCPVCGSPEHPRPAAFAVERVTLEEEEAAQSDAQDADDERGCREQELAEVRAELAAARAVAGSMSAAELAGRVQRADHAVQEAVVCAAEVDPLIEQAQVLAQLVEAHRHDIEQHRLVRTEARTAGQALRARRDELAARLTAARGQDPSIGARRARLTAAAEAAEAACVMEQEFARARKSREAAGAALARRVRAGDWADVESAAAAVRSPGVVEELDREIRSFDAEERASAVLLADPDLRAASVEPPARPDRAQAALAAAQEELSQAAAAHASAAGVVHRLEQLAVQVGYRLDKLRPIQERFELVARLSSLLEGTSTDNSLRMRLSAYVLAARLEQVAVAASERLLRMSSGRYTLAHSDEAGGGRARSGLGLRVCDAWTGLQREPATLSGGESFSASLALALGLADVVTAETGGARIDTLFIDEGFGSLDEETLEDVLDVLDGLRDGGRCVGIVSHVADLRARIPAQLEVRKTRRGSTLAPHGPGHGRGDAETAA